MFESLRDRVRELRESRKKAARLRRLSPATRAAARETLARELGHAATSLDVVTSLVDANDGTGLLKVFLTIQQHTLNAADAVRAGMLEDDVLVDACRMTSRTCTLVLNCISMPGIAGDYRLNLGSDDELVAAADVASGLEKVLLDSLTAKSTLGTDEAAPLRALGSRNHAELSNAWRRLIKASLSAIDPITDRFVARLRAERFALAYGEAMRINWKLSGLPHAMITAGNLTKPVLDNILEVSNVGVQLSALAQRLNQTPEEEPSYGPVINLAAVQADNLKETVSELVAATAS